jgi:hypothetical protein
MSHVLLRVFYLLRPISLNSVHLEIVIVLQLAAYAIP